MSSGLPDRLRVEINPDLSNEMLDTVFGGGFLNSDQQILAVCQTNQELESRLTEDWQSFRPDDMGYTASTIHNAMAVACLPSLVATIDGQPQTYDIARSVFSRLQTVSDIVLRSGVIQDVQRPDNARLRSVGGELGTLATMWSGAKRDQLGDIDHVVPATTTQDEGTTCVKHHSPGRRYTGIDLIAREASAQPWPIQVKLSASESTRRRNRKRYQLDITTIYVEDLDKALTGGDPVVALLDTVVEEKDFHLEVANQVILENMIRQYKRGYNLAARYRRRVSSQLAKPASSVKLHIIARDGTAGRT